MKPAFKRFAKAKGRPRREPGLMNKTEARYAEQLKADEAAGKVDWWAFEGIKLRLANNTFLTVDFVVMRPDGSIEFHDVKAKWSGKIHVEDDAAVKMKVAAQVYWPFRFFYVGVDKSGFELKEVLG